MSQRTSESMNESMPEQWTLNEIKSLIGVINKNKIKEFKLKKGEITIHVVTRYQDAGKDESTARAMAPTVVHMAPAPVMQGMPSTISPAPSKPPEEAENSGAEKKQDSGPVAKDQKRQAEIDNLVEVKSPMVGTFYRAPSPESPPYVQMGDIVNHESVLCIVEAMKLMNEIKAEMNGMVMEILVENGQPVEYGQPMFKIKPA